jgi:hypothetical protein
MVRLGVEALRNVLAGRRAAAATKGLETAINPLMSKALPIMGTLVVQTALEQRPLNSVPCQNEEMIRSLPKRGDEMRYFFHIRSDDEYDTDVEGIELPSLEAAIEEAAISAREMVAERVLHQERIDHMRFEIASTDGQVLETLHFRDVVKIN